MDLRNVWMVERRQNLGLALEPGHPVLITCEVRRQDLQRDITFEPAVARAINLAHAACAEQAYDLVCAETGSRVQTRGCPGAVMIHDLTPPRFCVLDGAGEEYSRAATRS